MRAARRLASLALMMMLMSVIIGACGFTAETPPGGVLYCSGAADCPSGSSCDVDAHLCRGRADDVIPPRFVAVEIDDDDDGAIYADVAGFDEIVAVVTADEELGAATMILDALTGACDIIDAQRAACALRLPTGLLLDGAQTLALEIEDLAGNTAAASFAVTLDSAAPTVVAGSATVEIETGGVATQAAVATSVVTVTFVASEDLDAALVPIVALDALGARVPLTLVSRSGRVFVFQLAGAGAVPPGDHPVVAVLTDVFGHASAELDVVAVPFVVDAGICPRPAGVACVDFDGDGAFARDGCGTGNDDVDTDAAIHPGMIEIPGDELDNDGVGGEQPIDDLAGVFVDCVAGDDTAAGTSAAPLRTLAEAVLRTSSSGAGKAIFLGLCATPYAEPLPSATGTIIGGLDPLDDWRRTGLRSIISAPMSAQGLFDHVEVAEIFFTDGTLVDSVAAAAVTEAGRHYIARSIVRNLEAGGSSRIVASEIGTLYIDGDATLVRTIVSDRTEVGFSLVAVSSVFEGRDSVAIECNSAVRVSLFHSTLIVVNPGVTPALTAFCGSTEIVASSLVSNGGTVVEALLTPVTLLDSNLFGGNPLVDLSAGATAVDEAGVNGCEAIGCVASEGNTAVDPLTGLDFHLPAGSPLRDRLVDGFPAGAPPSVIADFDGDCRYGDAGADVGADELR